MIKQDYNIRNFIDPMRAMIWYLAGFQDGFIGSLDAGRVYILLQSCHTGPEIRILVLGCFTKQEMKNSYG